MTMTVDGICQNCNVRPATSFWTGDDSTGLALTHGMYQKWCDLCCLRAQLKRAKECAERIPELERKIKNELESELKGGLIV